MEYAEKAHLRAPAVLPERRVVEAAAAAERYGYGRKVVDGGALLGRRSPQSCLQLHLLAQPHATATSSNHERTGTPEGPIVCRKREEDGRRRRRRKEGRNE